MVNELINGEVDSKYVNDKGDNVKEGYKELVTSETAQEAYSRFLKICAESENTPLVHHCRGGKDRTRLGAMFLLLALGVKEEFIVQDYILTVIIREKRNQVKYEQYRKLTQNKDHLDYLMTILATRKDFIQTSIDLVKNMYESVELYMTQHLKLSLSEMDKLIQLYLEEGKSISQEN